MISVNIKKGINIILFIIFFVVVMLVPSDLLGIGASWKCLGADCISLSPTNGKDPIALFKAYILHLM